MKTRGTELLGIKYPIMQGGMQHLGTPELAAAVSNAGGLGTINVTIYPDLDEFRNILKRMFELTNKPFCVNISLLPDVQAGEQTLDYIKICGEMKVPVIETAGRRPNDLVGPIHEAGMIHIHKVPTVRHAISAQKLGVDAVTIVGTECGGHPGEDLIGTIVLANKAAQCLDIPVFAGGGVADGRGVAALLAMGISAVVIGTRFVATQECQLHQNYKDWMVNASENDTTLVQKSIRNMMRVANNATAQECLAMEAKGATLKELMAAISGARGKKAQACGDVEGGIFVVGQSLGLINDVPTVEQLINSMVEEIKASTQLLNSIIE